MSKVRQLAGDTIIYGASTVIGRLLNWLLLPLYIRTLSIEDNGFLTYLYGIIAIVQVFLSFGFETGFFRFAVKDNFKQVFSSLITFTFSISLFFFLIVLFYNYQLEQLLNVTDKGPVLLVIAGILVIDAISNLPFSMMRFQNQSLKYSIFRFGQVVLTVIFNLLFLIFLPKIQHHFSNDLFGFFGAKNGLINVFIANLLGSLVILLLLSKYIYTNLVKPNFALFKRIINYSIPIVVVGIFGMVNLNIDKLLIPKLIGGDNVFEILGIYGANFKLGVLMAIFTQSFRLAFEPFFFKNQDEANIKSSYALILNYFVGFGMIIFLGVLFYLPIVNLVLTKEYIEGNSIIPYVLLGQLFFGIFYSISLWYKLTDRTYFAIIFTAFGSLVSIVSNVLLIPLMGYIGAAISSFICYFAMALISYFVGQKYYRIQYNFYRILIYIVGGVLLYFISLLYSDINVYIKLTFNSLLFISFLSYFIYKENILSLLKIRRL